jgi:fructose-1,6-bisphosphatase I
MPGKVGTLASEEEDNPVLIDAMGNPVYSADVLVEQSVGGFVAVFDPLDGSSNVDAGIPTGTIFGIFETPEECELPDDTDDWDAAAGYCLSNALQPGANLAAAGYALYSSSTSLVFTLGNGVQMFTLDENIGEFVLTQPDLRIPSRGKVGNP